MFQWLTTLQFHKFDVIDPEQEVPPDGEKEKDLSWWKTKSLLNKIDKTNKVSSGIVQPGVEVPLSCSSCCNE